MTDIFEKLLATHRFDLVLGAAVVCLIGSFVTVRFLIRVRSAAGQMRWMQIALCGVIGGLSIWATHFVAMLSYEPTVDHLYDPLLTGMTLGIAILGMAFVAWLSTLKKSFFNALIAGVSFGLTIGVMHFAGTKALIVAGDIVWDARLWWTATLAGCGFGILMFHRLRWPMSRFCWLGGTLAMILAVLSLHFLGMAAYTIVPNPDAAIVSRILPETILAVMILSVAAVVLAVGLAVLTIERNIHRQTESLVVDASLHDVLTGLPNRQYFDKQLSDTEDDIALAGGAWAVMIHADLAQFQQINDRHGHSAGDHVLGEIGRRLVQLSGPDMVAARVGGDEFAFLFQGRDVQREAEELAKRILSEMTLPVRYGDTLIEPSASLGYATWPEDTPDFSALRSKSTLALAAAKADPENPVRAFDPVFEAELRETAALVEDLKVAVKRQELALHYQRQNRFSDQGLIGFEVLLRWHHHTRGPVSPGVFIPLAESTGLICDIGLWVLQEACTEAAHWPEGLSVAVNVAPQQLVQPNFVDHVASILAETGLSARRLELEITEESIIDDEGNTLSVMSKLRSMGIRIAMDDFGTGYSSLAMLQKFPFDLIKIDRSFVSDVHRLPLKAAIVRATLLLGKTLRIPVLAEGIEEKEELVFLRNEGCDVAQGFYFGRPVPQAEARALARNAQGLRAAS